MGSCPQRIRSDVCLPICVPHRFSCVNKLIIDTEQKQRENEAAAIAFGVLFSFTSVIAGAGWYVILLEISI